MRLHYVIGLLLIAQSVYAAEFQPPPLQVPDGFTIELVAAPPLVKYPMMACFDERGRLFIAESHGENLNKEQLLAKRHRFIRMLEDTDQDGKFDKSTIFADKLVMPEGALWHRGSLYVLSSPYLWKFTDTDDDGVADEREKLVGYMDLTGQANQHGAYLGPNGRLYFSGGHVGYDITGSDGVHVAKGRAAAVFSCWEDGSDAQVYGNGGINPVEVAFTSDGELLTTCPIFDSIGGRHDALIHWVRGATAGPKDYAPPVLKQTGYRIPSVRRWGQVAPSGLCRYRSGIFGDKYRDSFFATHFNTATVVNSKLKRVGSTFEGVDEPFVTSTSRDFHPTDVLEDADGSLLIIDTGGWFLISCPFSQVSKPEIKGAIYRIRKQDAQTPADPRGLKIDWNADAATILPLLDDPRPVVRDRAIECLAARGDEAIQVIQEAWDDLNERTKRNAIWSISRVNTELSRGQCRVALGDIDDSVVRAAARSVGVARDGLGVTSLWTVLQSESLPNRRVAATALGAIGDATSIPHIFAALQQPGDVHLNHALVYALIEIAEPTATAKGLTHADPRVQHAALMALDQMQAPLEREQVLSLLKSSDPRLQETALNVITSRKGWSDEVIGLLSQWLKGQLSASFDQDTATTTIATFASDQRVQFLVTNALSPQATDPDRLHSVLASIGRVRDWPAAWRQPIRRLLANAPDDIKLATLEAIGSSGNTHFHDDLLKLASESNGDLATAVWTCMAATRASLPEAGLRDLVQQATNAESPLDRLDAAQSLSRATIGKLQLAELMNVLPELAANEQAVVASKIQASIGDDTALLRRWQELERQLNRQQAGGGDDGPDPKRLNQLLGSLVPGDAKHGEAIFYSKRAACSACHTVAGKGGDTGPDLSAIGSIRRRPDLLEAIVYPSSTIVNSYESYTVLLADGRTAEGVIQRTDSRWLVLRNTQREDAFIAREDIEDLQRSKVSVMPADLHTNLSTEELSDLLAYLESLGR